MNRKTLLPLCALVSAAFTTQNMRAANPIWVSDSHDGSHSDLYEMDSVTGALLSSIPGPGLYADALSFANDGNSIFVLDSSNNSTVYQINLSGTVLNSYHVNLDAEGLTILADGTLWVGGGLSGVIQNLNPVDGSVISSFPVAHQLFGMASNGTDTLYGLRIDGTIDSYSLTGTLLGSLDTDVPGTTLGLAYSNDGFFIAAPGSTVTKVDLSGHTLYSFPGPGAFSEGLDFPVGVQVPTPDAGSSLVLLIGSCLALAAFRPTAKS